MRLVWMLVNGSTSGSMPSAPERVMVSNAMSSSSRLRALIDATLIPAIGADRCTSTRRARIWAKSGFHNTPSGRDNFGTISFSSYMRLAPSSGAIIDRPVMLPPGRARLLTKPSASGSDATGILIGNQAFALDEQFHRRLGRRFEAALALWSAADDIHMVMSATFNVGK